MSLDLLFSTGNALALVGWLLLLASPLLPDWTRTIPKLAIPALIGIAYVALVLANWSSAEGGFSTLDDVAALFRSREILLVAAQEQLVAPSIILPSTSSSVRGRSRRPARRGCRSGSSYRVLR